MHWTQTSDFGQFSPNDILNLLKQRLLQSINTAAAQTEILLTRPTVELSCYQDSKLIQSSSVDSLAPVSYYQGKEKFYAQ